MCTLAVYVRQLPGFPLIVAANRDEFLSRPATAPLLLAAAPRVVGGRDLLAGGTWLGLSERGLAAGLLNRRAAAPPIDGKRSRGLLLLETLAAATAEEAARALATIDPDAYNAFTLMVGDATATFVVQNRRDAMHVATLEPGVHVLSNLDAGDPVCPKVARSHEQFVRAGEAFAATRNGEAFRIALHAILADHTIALDPRLPDALGALCVHTEQFGTRCSSLLFLDEHRRWRHWFADGPPCRTTYEPALTP